MKHSSKVSEAIRELIGTSASTLVHELYQELKPILSKEGFVLSEYGGTYGELTFVKDVANKFSERLRVVIDDEDDPAVLSTEIVLQDDLDNSIRPMQSLTLSSRNWYSVDDLVNSLVTWISDQRSSDVYQECIAQKPVVDKNI